MASEHITIRSDASSSSWLLWYLLYLLLASALARLSAASLRALARGAEYPSGAAQSSRFPCDGTQWHTEPVLITWVSSKMSFHMSAQYRVVGLRPAMHARTPLATVALSMKILHGLPAREAARKAASAACASAAKAV